MKQLIYKENLAELQYHILLTERRIPNHLREVVSQVKETASQQIYATRESQFRAAPMKRMILWETQL